MALVGDAGQVCGGHVHFTRTAFIDSPMDIDHGQVFDPQAHQQLSDGGTGSPAAVHHHFHLADVLLHIPKGPQDGCAGDDGGAVLVVVEDGDLAPFDQFRFHRIAFGGRDVFQVDASERGLEFFHDVDEFFRIFGIDTDGHRIHVTEFLIQHSLPFHDGHGGFRTDVPQAQDPGAVADYGHHIASPSVFEGKIRILLDLPAGFSHPGGISQGQVMAVFQRYLAAHLQLSVVLGMEFQCLFVQFFRICHFSRLLSTCSVQQTLFILSLPALQIPVFSLPPGSGCRNWAPRSGAGWDFLD